MSHPTHLLFLDWETSGVPSPHQPGYFDGPQGIWLGYAVVPVSTWEPVLTRSLKVKYQGVEGTGKLPAMTWSRESEKFHGLTVDDTVNNGGDPVDAAAVLVGDIAQFWPSEERVVIAGHNPMFDRHFTYQLLAMAGRINAVDFHFKMVDTYGIGLVNFWADGSNTLFESFGVFRDKHDPLEDALACLKVVKAVREMNAQRGPVGPGD